MKTKNRNLPNPVSRGFPPSYDPKFKKTVILYAEDKGNNAAKKHFGICEETIRRWRKHKEEIVIESNITTRSSQRNKGKDTPKQTPTPTSDLDSMPLQQRISQHKIEPSTSDVEKSSTSTSNEPDLKSVSSLPVKLNVTRLAKSQLTPILPKTTPIQKPTQVCLKWNSHHMNMRTSFPNLLVRGSYVDATLVSEGKILKCHRMILSACSPYFEEILSGIEPLQHPVLFMKNIPFWTLKALCDFMYSGEVHIMQDKVPDLLKVAVELKIKGLAAHAASTNNLGNINSRKNLNEIPKNIPSNPANKVPSPTPVKLTLENSPMIIFQAPKPELIKPVTKIEPKTTTEVKNIKKNPEKGQFHYSPLIPVSCNTNNTNQPKISPHEQLKTSYRTYQKSVPARKILPAPPEMGKKPLKKSINDPLDLLQPVYEEIAKQASTLPISVADKAKNPVRIKKTITRKVRKRKRITLDYTDDEEEPPTSLPSIRGTRSRPNIKTPNRHAYNSKSSEKPATIVRVPHTDRNLMEIGEIKSELLDVEDNRIQMDENMMDFTDQDTGGLQVEQIMGNYDSPLVNQASASNSSRSVDKEDVKVDIANLDKRYLKSESSTPQIIISDVYSIEENVKPKNSNDYIKKPVSTIAVKSLADLTKIPDDTVGTDAKENTKNPTLSCPEEVPQQSSKKIETDSSTGNLIDNPDSVRIKRELLTKLKEEKEHYSSSISDDDIFMEDGTSSLDVKKE